MRLLLLITCLVFFGCGKDEDVRSSRSLNKFETTKNYFTSSTKLTVEVAYESGQQPYADGSTIGAGVPIWQILDENLHALYQGRTQLPVIIVPKTHAEMKELPVQGKTSWTPEDIIKLSEKHRTGRSSASETYFWVVFLDGVFNDGTTNQPSTIGVSLGGTTVVAIFKEVVRQTGSGVAGFVPLYVEQATLVHEIGHALGLVDNGLPMKEAHKDTEGHGAHCNNDKCVMYWLNEGRSDLIQFAIRMNQTGNVIMYDQNCLNDARGF